MKATRKTVKRLMCRRVKTQLDLRDGDCVEAMQKMPAASVDLVVTSPPYNLGIKYGHYSDDQQREVHLLWCETWGKLIHKVLNDDGALFLNVGGSPSNPMFPHEIAKLFSETFHLQNTFHWIKAITIEDEDGGAVSRGHFKPINSNRFVNDCHEYVFHFTKTGAVPIQRLAVGVPYADKSNIARWSHTDGEDKRCRGNTWFIPYKTIRDRNQERPHPATFPPALAAQCIKLHGIHNKMVMLDPFLGIGNAGLAAKHCGVPRFIGCEIDPDYMAVAREKLNAK
jgi:site-specific DNA-methyltransferase (adenine-specific)